MVQKSFLSVAALLFILAPTMRADTIIAQTNATAGTNLAVGGVSGSSVDTFTGAITWTQSSTYDNVAITADLSFVLGTGATQYTLTAFLMSAIGPGTTTAQQLASSTLTDSNTGFTTRTLFSGLTLGPGTYYLVLWGPNDCSSPGGGPGGTGCQTTPSEARWAATSSPSITTAPGVTGGNELVANGPSPVYPPAQTFVSSGGFVVFSVTGDPAGGGSGVPEPSSLSMLGLGVLGLLGFARRRSQA